MFVTPEELLAGGEATFDVEIPAQLLTPALDDGAGGRGSGKCIRLRPLSVKDIQLIARGAKDDEVLTSVLMIQRAAVEPALTHQAIGAMPGGLVQFLVERINRISGLTTTDDELREIAGSPLVQAFFVLAREFNWTPRQIQEMTVGQVLGYLELLNQTRRRATG